MLHFFAFKHAITRLTKASLRQRSPVKQRLHLSHVWFCRIKKSWDNPNMCVWLFVKANLIFASKTARTWLYGVCMCVCPQSFAMGVSSLLVMLMSRATTCPSAVFFISIALGLYSFTSGWVSWSCVFKLILSQNKHVKCPPFNFTLYYNVIQTFSLQHNLFLTWQSVRRTLKVEVMHVQCVKVNDTTELLKCADHKFCKFTAKQWSKSCCDEVKLDHSTLW